MKINRRKFLGSAAVGGGAMAIASCTGATPDAGKAPAASRALTPSGSICFRSPRQECMSMTDQSRPAQL